MRKWTVSLLFVLTLLLLVGLAFLPAVAGLLQDAGFEETPSFHPLHSIAPYISEKGSGLSISQKLAVLYQSEVSNVVPALASMTEPEVRETVFSQLRPYMDAEQFLAWEYVDVSCIPLVAISWQDPSQYLLFWSVSLTAAGSDYKQFLHVAVDDETGMLLTLEFDFGHMHEPEDSESAFSFVDRFAQIWLRQTGLMAEAEPVSDTGNQTVSTDPLFHKIGYRLPDAGNTPLYVFFCTTYRSDFMMWFNHTPE